MKIVCINPNWTFDGSIYFGCREPHLPLEFGAARTLLEARGHTVFLIDAHLFGLTEQQVYNRVAEIAPEVIVVTTAPTYLFWRCPPPELRVPKALLAALQGLPGLRVAVGPHGSTTPRAALAKLGVDLVVIGECEDTLLRIAAGERFSAIPGLCWRDDRGVHVSGGPQASQFVDLPPLVWPDRWIGMHRHHHHRFDAAPDAPGAEVEFSRGCPYSCTFCAKENYRDRYRRRPVETVITEIAALKAQGVRYVYFIDEIFLPHAPLLAALAELGIQFGVQTRIDLWKPDMLRALGQAGCVSIEAGVESLTTEGRATLDKQCRMSTAMLAERLIEAKAHIPFVQANLIATPEDDAEAVYLWRETLTAQGVWANDPVPLFPYPGSPDYRKLWGEPDDSAWERAVDYYLDAFVDFSDIQDERPLHLHQLEGSVHDVRP